MDSKKSPAPGVVYRAGLDPKPEASGRIVRGQNFSQQGQQVKEHSCKQQTQFQIRQTSVVHTDLDVGRRTLTKVKMFNNEMKVLIFPFLKVIKVSEVTYFMFLLPCLI
jgi:hypothetical protein